MKRHSIYRKTTSAIFVLIMISFFIVSVLYYQTMMRHTGQQNKRTTYNFAITLRDEIEFLLKNPENKDINLTRLMNTFQKVLNAKILFTKNNGEIIMYSGLQKKDTDLFERRDGELFLPEKYLIKVADRDGRISDFHERATGLFKYAKKDFFSVIFPVGYDDEPVGFLQVYQTYTTDNILQWFLTNGFGIGFLVALVICILLSLILMGYVTLPVERLSEAAKQVIKGDLSVRVKHGGDNNPSMYDIYDLDDDISQLIATFNTMVEKLQEEQIDRRDLIAGLSHDMKTPLTSVIGFTNAILDGTIPESKREHYLKIILQESRRIQSYINEINADEELDAQEMTEMEVFDINSLIKKTIHSLEISIQNKKLKIEYEMDQNKAGNLLVKGIEKDIKRVFNNLINNSIKFSNEEDKILIKTEYVQKTNTVRVYVDDSGIGVPYEKRRLVFGRLYKGDKSRSAVEGSGLGLYICKKIMTKHGQFIGMLDSKLGGACFMFTLEAVVSKKDPYIPYKNVKESDKKKKMFSRGNKNE